MFCCSHLVSLGNAGQFLSLFTGRLPYLLWFMLAKGNQMPLILTLWEDKMSVLRSYLLFGDVGRCTRVTSGTGSAPATAAGAGRADPRLPFLPEPPGAWAGCSTSAGRVLLVGGLRWDAGARQSRPGP